MRPIVTPDAPAPRGHYSQAIACGDLIFVAAQLGIDGDGRLAASVAEQARRALQNAGSILRAAGSDLGRTVKVCFFIASIEDWAVVDDVCEEVFGPHRPARSVIGCTGLHLDARVAVEVVACA